MDVKKFYLPLSISFLFGESRLQLVISSKYVVLYCRIKSKNITTNTFHTGFAQSCSILKKIIIQKYFM